jgi:hypothetical protein
MRRIFMVVLLLLTVLLSGVPLRATSVDPQQYAFLTLGMQETDILAWLGPPDQTRRMPHTILVIRQRDAAMRRVEKHVVVYRGGCGAATTTLTFLDGVLVAKESERAWRP